MVTKGLSQPFYVLTDAETDPDRKLFRIRCPGNESQQSTVKIKSAVIYDNVSGQYPCLLIFSLKKIARMSVNILKNETLLINRDFLFYDWSEICSCT